MGVWEERSCPVEESETMSFENLNLYFLSLPGDKSPERDQDGRHPLFQWTNDSPCGALQAFHFSFGFLSNQGTNWETE